MEVSLCGAETVHCTQVVKRPFFGMKLIYIMFMNFYLHHTKQLSEVCFIDAGQRSVKTSSPAPYHISGE